MKIYMIGIGGIGMSALAQLYLSEGHEVSGSDRENSPTTDLLEKKGVRVLIRQKADNVPKDAGLVVYSDAVWEDNPERVRAKELKLREVSYFEGLGEFSKDKYTIAVAGTHGKTTTTAMLAKVLQQSGKNPTAVIGSIIPEFESNFLEGSEKLFVVEACEYKDHILDLTPSVLVITNVEWDHTDWFPSLSALQKTFERAVSALPKEGALITDSAHPHIAPIAAKAECRVIDYTKQNVPNLQIPGEFNIANARAAKAAARALFPDIPEAAIDRSLSSFKGAWRRFEKKGTTKEGALVYDDYAHHPTAIAATLRAARQKFPGQKIIVAFHPHLYTRTRDLMEEFAASFSDADLVLLAPIYPAREEPIPGITSEALADKIRSQGKEAEALPSLEAAYERLRELSSKDSIIFTMGAGDIYKIAVRLIHAN